MGRVFSALITLCLSSLLCFAQTTKYEATDFVSWNTPTGVNDYWTNANTFPAGPTGCTVNVTLTGHIADSTFDFDDNEMIRGYVQTLNAGRAADIHMMEFDNRHGPYPRNQVLTVEVRNVDLRSTNSNFPYIQAGVAGLSPTEPPFWDGGRYDMHATGTWSDPPQQ